MPQDENVNEPHNEIEIDDDALEMVSGGLKNITQNTTYSYNQTIYFQASITNTDGT
jgi:hypothetical protein